MYIFIACLAFLMDFVFALACLYMFVSIYSLGGNCMTTMIATCAVEKKNIDVRLHSYNSF